MNPLDELLRHRWARSAAMFFACATAIALGGAYLGIGPFHPLGSPVARALAIVALAVFWILALWWHERGTARQEKTVQVRALRARFARGMTLLRKRGSLDRPWYLVIGPAASGKSAWLASAGFERVLAPWRAVATAESQAWPSFDWWTDGRAVMLEAEGSHGEGDDAWRGLLRLVRRRARGRLAGIVVTVGMPEPLAEAVDDEARRLRARLDEALAASGRLPVYLLVTHADHVAGFSECFAVDGEGERAQVWGATFADVDHDDGRIAVRVSAQVEALAERLDGQLTRRLRPVRDASTRFRLFTFTQQLRWHGASIASLVDTVFGARAHGRAPMLRGFYLVSTSQDGVTHEGIDASLDAHFGIHGQARPPARPARRAYFGQRLVGGVMLPEAGLGRSPGNAWRRWVFACCLPVFTMGIVWAMLERHALQARLMERVARTLDAWPGDTTLPTSLRVYYARALWRLDVLAGAERLVDNARREASFMSRLVGPGDVDLHDVLRAARMREVAEGVLPGLAAQWREAMRTRDPRQLYLALKGHLMLAQPERRDDAVLRRLAKDHWRTVFDDDGLVAALDRHMGDLFAPGAALAAMSLDRPLVEAARASLRTADAATLVYAELVSGVGRENDEAIRPDRALGLFADVFRRKSGEPLSSPLSPLHTRSGFVRMLGDASAEGDVAAAVARFADEAWVLGTPRGRNDRATLESRVRAIYVADYLAAWDGWLADLEWQPGQAAVDAARLSGPASPLKALLLLLREHTQGLGEGTNSPGRALAASRIGEHFAPLTSLVDGEPGQAPLDRVLAALDALGRQLMAAPTDTFPAARTSLDALRMEANRLPSPLSSWIEDLAGSGQAMVRRRTGDALETVLREAVGSDCAALVEGRYPFVPDGARDVPLHDFATLFGHGGRMDVHFQRHLATIVDTSRSVWRFRDGVTAGSAEVLAIARASAAIRDAWFQGSAQPTVGFTLSIVELPPGVGRVTVDVDGQVYERAIGKPAGTVRMRWPGPAPTGTTIHAWDAEGHPLPVLHHPGEWGLFHALDAAHLERRTETRFDATFEPGGRTVRVGVEADSLHHPFADTAVRRFRCPS